MSEERRMILEMLRDGAVDVDEAERLLSAIPNTDVTIPDAPKRGTTGPALNPKRLRMYAQEGGKAKFNMTVPFSVVRAGLKIAQVVGPKYSEEAKFLETIDIDEILESLNTGEITLPYTIMEGDDEEKGEHILIVLE